MSFFVKTGGKYLLQKIFGTVTVGKLEEDPYSEVIPDKELHFWQKHGATRTRGIPDAIPPDKRAKLEKVQKMAYRIDACFSSIGVRIGWGGVLGIIPGIGDASVVLLSLMVFKAILDVDNFPFSLRAHMVWNIILDCIMLLIPFIGDIFSVAYRSNTRNFTMARDYLIKKYSTQTPAEAVRLDNPPVVEKPAPAKSKYSPPVVPARPSPSPAQVHQGAQVPLEAPVPAKTARRA